MNKSVDPLLPGCFVHVERSIDRVARRMPELPRQAVLLVRLNAHVARMLNERLNAALRPYDLNHVGFMTLMMVFGSEERAVNPSRLSEATAETRTNMTRITNELVKRRLLARRHSTEDRRRVVLSMTAQGEKLIARMLPLLWRDCTAYFDQFSIAEKAALERLLKKELSAIDALPTLRSNARSSAS